MAAAEHPLKKRKLYEPFPDHHPGFAPPLGRRDMAAEVGGSAAGSGWGGNGGTYFACEGGDRHPAGAAVPASAAGFYLLYKDYMLAHEAISNKCIWSEIGESEDDKDRMLLEIEKECLELYRRKVDQASNAKARLRQTVAAKEAEVAALMASLGEHGIQSKTDKTIASLNEQLASVTPLLENLRAKKLERAKQFADIQSHIEKITAEMTEQIFQNDVVASAFDIEENDLSLRKLNEYQGQLHALKKEKSLMGAMES